MIDLTCDTIGELNHGAARMVVDAALRVALLDIQDRGGDEKPRKVVITLTIEKASDEQIVTTLEVQSKVPAYRTGGTVANLAGVGHRVRAEFNPHSPGNPDQKTILDERE